MEPIGECIYCGKRPPEVELTDEHIIAFGLDGRAILPEASCVPCASMTGRFEGTILRDWLWPIRTILGLQTRRPKDRPTSFPVRLTMTNGLVMTRHIPVVDYPPVLMAMELAPPAFLLGTSQSEFGHVQFKQVGDPSGIPLMLKKYGAVEAVFLSKIRPDVFARFIAKIAHCAAVWGGHFGTFKPLLLPLIFGDYNQAWHYVGGLPDDRSEPPTNDMHIVDVRWQNRPQGRLLVARVWLFADLGARPHIAVVGYDCRGGDVIEPSG